MTTIPPDLAEKILRLVYDDDFAAEIFCNGVASGPMNVMLIGADGRSWKGNAQGIDQAVALAMRMLMEQRAASGRDG